MKLSTSTAYVVEYLVRFVARLRPKLPLSDAEDIMRRLVGALTHQSVVIRDETHPVGKKFPKLRGGTGDSTLKFMMKLYYIVGGGIGGEHNEEHPMQGNSILYPRLL